MKYLKSLALFISLSTLASCTEAFEDCPTDVYSINENKETKASEPNDTTGSGQISILIDEPKVEDIDYIITIP